MDLRGVNVDARPYCKGPKGSSCWCKEHFKYTFAPCLVPGIKGYNLQRPLRTLDDLCTFVQEIEQKVPLALLQCKCMDPELIDHMKAMAADDYEETYDEESNRLKDLYDSGNFEI